MKSNKPAIKTIMSHYGLTLESVSRRAGCTLVQAYKALHLTQFRLLSLIIIARVRRSIEDELRERGWRGRTEQLWTDFTDSLERYLQGNRPASPRARRGRHVLSR